ncbi:MAG: triose-phosphate isomerase [Planctomycetota bacterium]|nr:triose-phosphate isomerase [Planctomycetota bacterium]
MTTTRTPLIAGNWKMNGTREEARGWAAAAAEALTGSTNDAAVFPPDAWLCDVAEVLASAGGAVALGGQSCCWEPKGAFTGATSAAMLAEVGCRYVLCGHSERRHVFGESDADVAGSMAQALAAGLTPVLCVGETIEEREAGRTQEVLLTQVDAGLGALRGADDPLVIAYEPVWAIGTGKAATPTEAAEAHAWIRARVAETDAERAERVRILYGGSVNPDNIGGFLDVPDVDGALIGGAALDPVKFGLMIRHASTGA